MNPWHRTVDRAVSCVHLCNPSTAWRQEVEKFIPGYIVFSLPAQPTLYQTLKQTKILKCGGGIRGAGKTKVLNHKSHYQVNTKANVWGCVTKSVECLTSTEGPGSAHDTAKNQVKGTQLLV